MSHICHFLIIFFNRLRRRGCCCCCCYCSRRQWGTNLLRRWLLLIWMWCKLVSTNVGERCREILIRKWKVHTLWRPSPVAARFLRHLCWVFGMRENQRKQRSAGEKERKRGALAVTVYSQKREEGRVLKAVVNGLNNFNFFIYYILLKFKERCEVVIIHILDLWALHESDHYYYYY